MVGSFSICFLQFTKMLLKPFKAILNTFIFSLVTPPLTKPDLKFFKVFLLSFKNALCLTHLYKNNVIPGSTLLRRLPLRFLLFACLNMSSTARVSLLPLLSFSNAFCSFSISSLTLSSSSCCSFNFLSSSSASFF